MSDLALATRDEVIPLPGGIELPGQNGLRVVLVSATFNGAGAASAFKPCVSFYSQSGHLLGRFFPSQDMNPGDSGEVTYGPFLGNDAVAGFGAGARVYNTNVQSIPDFTETTLTFNSERWDTHGFWEGVTHPTRLTIPPGVDGLFELGGNIDFDANVNGDRYISIIHQGGTETDIAVQTQHAPNSRHCRLNLNTQWQCTAGDYFELRCWQDSGGALNVGNEQAWSCEFWCARLRP